MDDPRSFVDFQTVLWDVDDRTCTIFMGVLILFYDRIVDMEEKWTKSTYQDQSGLFHHDHFDMDSNGKKIKRKAKVKAHVASGTAATFARKEKAGASY